MRKRTKDINTGRNDPSALTTSTYTTSRREILQRKKRFRPDGTVLALLDIVLGNSA